MLQLAETTRTSYMFYLMFKSGARLDGALRLTVTNAGSGEDAKGKQSREVERS